MARILFCEAMLQAIEVFPKTKRKTKSTLKSNKRQRITAPSSNTAFTCESKEDFASQRFRESWKCINEEFYRAMQKHKETLIEIINQILKDTYDDPTLPAILVHSEASEIGYTHLIQQVRARCPFSPFLCSLSTILGS